MQAVRRITLANGLRVNLIQDPDASRTAALIQLSAGSHDGPRQWPGLAHLLEHVLFAGSQGYQDDQRLMAWGPANGCRLNATTLAHHTAWFFDSAPDKLEQGLLRLVDMLAHPLLTLTSVRQETAVIDAEFQMLTRHTDTLCEAALSQAFVSPSRLHDFHVGDLAAFGDDCVALQQALRDYHQRFFRADNLELWLQGPQSLAALGALAEEAGVVFAAAPAEKQPDVPVLTLTPQRRFGLHIATAERLQLSAVVAASHRELMPVLRELLTDSATGSLLATLRRLGLAESVSLTEPHRSPLQSVFSVQFDLCGADGEAAVEALFHHWVQQLAGLDKRVLAHYAGLARRRFAQLSGLDQLRARAFGWVPPEVTVPLAERWPCLLAALQPEKLTALWVSGKVDASPVQVQGFSLHTAALNDTSGSGTVRSCQSGPEMTFYAAGEASPSPSLPDARAALAQFPASCQPLLLLNPVGDFPPQAASIIEAALQPVAGLCQHQGGELRFAQQQGIWLLQLTAPPARLPAMLSALIDTLSAVTPAVSRQGERRYHRALQTQSSDIAIRVLLARLPEVLSRARMPQAEAGDKNLNSQTGSAALAEDTATSPQASESGESVSEAEPVPWNTSWQAALYGGDRGLHDALSAVLSRWPGAGIEQPERIRKASAAMLADELSVPYPRASLLSSSASGEQPFTPPEPLQHVRVETVSEDAAVLLFCPLIDRTAECLAAWQLLASFYEPEFFQRLRVEQNIGYVVSCRFHQCAGEAGILFALQSPALSHQVLITHMANFIASMADYIDSIDEDSIGKKSRDLSNALPVSFPHTTEQCLEHWQQQQLKLPALTPPLFQTLSAEIIRQYHRRLASEKGRWQWLINCQNSVSSGNK